MERVHNINYHLADCLKNLIFFILDDDLYIWMIVTYLCYIDDSAIQGSNIFLKKLQLVPKPF